MFIQKKIFMRYICLLSLVVLFSCKGIESSSEKEGDNIAFQTLITASQSNIEKPQQTIISSQKQLQQVFSEINKTRKPGIPIPEINFNDEVVVFINMGQSSTGGYSVEVESIKKINDEIVVFVGGDSPEPNDNVTMVITTPFTMVKLNKQKLPIVFKPSKTE